MTATEPHSPMSITYKLNRNPNSSNLDRLHQRINLL